MLGFDRMEGRKRPIFVIMAVLALILCCTGCEAPENKAQENVEGPGQTVEAYLPQETDASDDNGPLFALEKQVSYEKGEKMGETVYEYDEYGRLVRVEIDSEPVERWDETLQLYLFTHRADGTFDYALTYEYDEGGNVIRKTYLNLQSDNPAGNYYDYQYEFDENGNITRCVACSQGQEEAVGYVIDYVWEDGRLIWEQFWCTEDSFYDEYKGAYHYHYDAQGKICSVDFVGWAGIVTVSVGYDELDRMSQIHWKIIAEAEEDLIQYSYDSDGNLLPRDEEIQKFEYDEFGNLIAVRYADGDYTEYMFRRIDAADGTLWNGDAISAVRQSYVTGCYPLHILGVSYGACVFDLE